MMADAVAEPMDPEVIESLVEHGAVGSIAARLPCRDLRQGFFARLQDLGRGASHEEDASWREPLVTQMEDLDHKAAEPYQEQYCADTEVQIATGSQAAHYQHLEDEAEVETGTDTRAAPSFPGMLRAAELEATIDLEVANDEPLLPERSPAGSPAAPTTAPAATPTRRRRRRLAVQSTDLPTTGLFAIPCFRQLSLRTQALRDGLVMSLLRTQPPSEGLSSPRARRLMSNLNGHLATGMFFAGVGALVGMWLLFRGVSALTGSTGAECQCSMRNWLFGFVWLQLAGPISVPIAAIVRRASPHIGRVLLQVCWPLATLALVIWCIVAITNIAPTSMCTPLRGFLLEALALQSTTILLLGIAFLYVLASQPIITRLNEMIACDGMLVDTAGLVAEVDPMDAPAKEECVICLGCMEDDDEDVQGGPSGGGLWSETEARELRSLELTPTGCEEDVEIGQVPPSKDPLWDCARCTFRHEGRLSELTSCSICEAPRRSAAAAAEEASSLPMCCGAPKPRPPWRRLRCGHRFHETCLFTWLRKVKRCPICRSHMRDVPTWCRAQTMPLTSGENLQAPSAAMAADSLLPVVPATATSSIAAGLW